MKYPFFILIMTMISYSCFAQSNTFPLSGGVGIGTIAPTSELELLGNFLTRHKGDNVANTTISNINFMPNGTQYNNPVATIAASFSGINWFNGTKLSFFTNPGPDITATSSLERLTIASSGYVGIGTTTPGSELELLGNFSSRHKGDNIANTSISDINFIPNGTQYNNPVATIKASFTGNSWFSGTKLSFFTNPGPDITATSNLERLTIVSNGYVGIGTTAPDAELSVNGTIHSKVVKVDMAGFPDYVFKPTYHLLTLNEVKAFINQNHHLPEMPTEEEVKKEGVNIGELNGLLVKKIEELTLYLIQQKEVTDKQQKQINMLKNQLIELKKR